MAIQRSGKSMEPDKQAQAEFMRLMREKWAEEDQTEDDYFTKGYVNKIPMTEEEEADEIVRRLKTKPEPIITYRSTILPLIKRIIPTIIANEILGVQPMQGSTSQAFTLLHKYGKQETTPPDDKGTGS